MGNYEHHLDAITQGENGPSINFASVVDYQAWKDTFASKRDAFTPSPNHVSDFDIVASAVNFGSSDKGDPKKGQEKQIDNGAIKELVGKLGDTSFDVRERATEDLKALGPAALPYLKDAIKSEDLEVNQRARGIADSMLAKYSDTTTVGQWAKGMEKYYLLDDPAEAKAKSFELPKMASNDWSPEQARERSVALQALADFKRRTGYGSLEAEQLEQQAKEWQNVKGTLARVSELNFTGWGKNATDETLSGLRHFPNLKSLTLYGTAVTDRGLAQLKDLSRLRQLDLAKTSITDQGAEQLKELKNLEVLRLHGTKVTDTGVKSLTRLNYLEELDINCTKTTDKCLDSLKELPTLKKLNIGGTEITPEGRKKLADVEFVDNYT